MASSEAVRQLSRYQTPPSGTSAPSPPAVRERLPRLPPVESRETVRAQAWLVDGWQELDPSKDLIVSVRTYQRTPSEKLNELLVGLNLVTPLFVPSPPLLQTSPSLAATQARKRKGSPDAALNAKRRIVPSDQALRIAQSHSGLHQNPQSRLQADPRFHGAVGESNDIKIHPTFLTPRALDTGAKRAEDASIDNDIKAEDSILYQDENNGSAGSFQDEGYHSFKVCPQTDGIDLTGHDDDTRVFHQLVTFQQDNGTSTKSVLLPSTAEDPAITAERQALFEEQKQGTARSRQLREQALARRRVHETQSNDTASVIPDHGTNSHSIDGNGQILDGTPPNVAHYDVESTLEAGIEFARKHAIQGAGSGDVRDQEVLRSHRHRQDPNAQNPASRTAAERFRTLSRYLGGQDESAPLSVGGLEERERRLSAVKAGSASTPAGFSEGGQNQSTLSSGSNLRLNPAHPESSGSSQRQDTLRSEKGRQSVLELLASRGSQQDSNEPGQGPRGIRPRANDSTQLPTPLEGVIDHLPGPQLRGLGTHPDANDAPPPGQISRDSLNLILPPKFDSFPAEEQAVLINHEKARNRERDLRTLSEAMWATAHLGCLGPFSELDRREINEIKSYMTLVVGQCDDGKTKRTRIQNIRENMKRRSREYEVPPDTEIQRWLKRLFDFRDLDKLESELKKAKEQVVHWRNLRSAHTAKRNNEIRRKSTKRVRFAAPAERGGRQATHRSEQSTNKAEIRRQEQYRQQDQRIEQIRAQLSQFDVHGTGTTSGVEDSGRAVTLSDSDEESEEDEGADLVFGAGRGTTGNSSSSNSFDHAQDIEEINRLEEFRQHENDTDEAPKSPGSRGVPSQAFDADLLRRMQAKASHSTGQPNSTTESGVVATDDDDDYDDDSEVESDSSTDDDEDEPRQIFKYTVRGVFAGVEIYRDADEYIFKSSYKVSTANALVRSIIESVLREFPPKGGINDGRWTLESRHWDGLCEQHLKIGDGHIVEARVWIQKDLVDLDKKAFRDAKAKRIAQQRGLFAVEWEQTVTSLQKPATQPTRDIDPLFDVAPQDNDQPTASTTTIRIPTEEIEYFSTPILANRHAKDLYMEWYTRCLPGLHDESRRRLEDEATEKSLETMDTWGLWHRTQTVRSRTADGDGPIEWRCSVWVRQIEVLGPGN